MPVHKLSFTLTTFWELLTYTESTLLAFKPVSELSKPVTKHMLLFKQLHDAELEAGRKTRQIQALVAIANLVLDEALTDLHNDVLGEAKQDRDAGAFKVLFSDPLSRQIRFGLDEQLKVVKQANTTLVENKALYSAGLLKTHGAALKAVIAQAEAAQIARDEHEAKLAGLRLRLEDWKRDANAVLTAVEGELKTYGANNKKSPKWHKMFFG